MTVVQVPDAKIALSTASVYPESTAAAFEMAARLGYDGVEVMVTQDPVSQDIEALRKLSDYHGIAILAIHAPCLIITRQVWGTEPWGKLVKARDVAEKLGSPTVVVHPPFRWQREYARDFIAGIERMANETYGALRRGEHVPAARAGSGGCAVLARLRPERGRLPPLHP